MDLIQCAEEIGLFCRLNMNTKKDIPIRSSEMGVLIYIYKQGETTPLMISQFFRIKKPSVTTQINALIKHEYIQKTPSKTDGRSVCLTITDKGKNLVENTFDDYLRLVSLLKDKMGNDQFNSLIVSIHQANTILGNTK